VANKITVFPHGRYIFLKKEDALYMGVWGHDMWSILGWKQKTDFHCHYDIYYEEMV